MVSISFEGFVLAEEADFSVASGGASDCTSVDGRPPPALRWAFFFELLDPSLAMRGNIELVGVGWTWKRPAESWR